ncbi:MAG: TIGR04211 family SH3 domain-containing protein [Methylococcaceae bacterium]|nr:TIGR04211 family SH3 domain-containing protein [Methylococcaceae bacterium]
MKKILSAFFILILTFGSAQAETVYVADDQNLSLRDSANINAKVLKSLPTGTPLTLIDKQTKGEFIHVRLIDGTEGYLKSRYTKKQPPALDPKDTASKTIAQLQSDNAALRTELNALKESLTPGSSLEKSLATERDQLARELNELKKTAASSFQLKNERDELQERVVNVERDLQQFKLENQVLKDAASQDWFLYGGILSLAGVLLGFILPKLGWHRKSSWDSF